jgi:hypothetical protein
VKQTIYSPELFGIKSECELQQFNIVKNLWLEAYQLYAPLLEVKVLDKVLTRVDDFYGDTLTENRKYIPYHLHIFTPLDPYTYNLTKMGIDQERFLTTFSVLAPELEALNLTLKEGDILNYDGEDQEIMTIKRSEEGYYLHTNYCFEFLISTGLPSKGQ